MTKLMTVNIGSEKMLQQMKAEAHAQGLNLSAFVRQLFLKYLEAKEDFEKRQKKERQGQ